MLLYRRLIRSSSPIFVESQVSIYSDISLYSFGGFTNDPRNVIAVHTHKGYIC